MAEIQTGMYPTAAPPGNLLGMVGQFAQAQNALNQNALFQQTFKARQALGPLAQQSIGPDGQMDYNKFSVLISSHPDTAWMAPDIINGIVQRQLVQSETVAKNLDIAKTKAGALGNYAGAAVANNPNGSLPQNEVMGVAAQIHALHLDGGGDPSDVIKWAATIGHPPGKDGQPDYSTPYDPKLAHKQLTQMQIAQQTAAETLGQTREDYTTKFGGGTQVGTRNKFTGQVTPSTGPGIQPGGVVPETAGPGFETTTTTGANAGQQQKTTVGQPLPPTPGRPGIESLMLPGKDQSRVAPGGGSGGPPNPAAPYGVPSQTTALSPVQSGQLKGTADYIDNLRNTVSSMKDQMQQIGEMKGALAKFDPNAGTEARMNMAGYLRTLGASPEVYNAVVGGDPKEALNAAQEFQKLSMQNATQQMINLLKGQGRLAVAEFIASLKNNPNVNMTREATQKIFDFTQRIYNLNSEELNGYEKWSAPAAQGGYGRDPVQFRSSWNNIMRKSGGSLDTQDPSKDLSPLIDSSLRRQIDALPKGK
jgi:hypothetical protein